MYLNQLTIIGFTGSEADVHYTTNGNMVVTLSVATKESLEECRRRMAEPYGMAPRCPVRLPTGRVRKDSGERLACDGAGFRPHA